MEDVCCESKSGVYYTKQSTHKFKVLVRVMDKDYNYALAAKHETGRILTTSEHTVTLHARTKWHVSDSLFACFLSHNSTEQ